MHWIEQIWFTRWLSYSCVDCITLFSAAPFYQAKRNKRNSANWISQSDGNAFLGHLDVVSYLFTLCPFAFEMYIRTAWLSCAERSSSFLYSIPILSPSCLLGHKSTKYEVLILKEKEIRSLALGKDSPHPAWPRLARSKQMPLSAFECMQTSQYVVLQYPGLIAVFRLCDQTNHSINILPIPFCC